MLNGAFFINTKKNLVLWQNVFPDECVLLSHHLVPGLVFGHVFDAWPVHQERVVHDQELIISDT